jgi:hypothetical protein
LNSSYEKVYTGQTIGGQLGYQAMNPPVKERSPTMLEALEKDLDVILNRVGHLNGRIGAVADRVLGQEPAAAGKTDSAPSQSASIARIADQVSRLGFYLNYTEEHFARLEKL